MDSRKPVEPTASPIQNLKPHRTIADLARGENYCNSDFIGLHRLGVAAPNISYDYGCDWIMRAHLASTKVHLHLETSVANPSADQGFHYRSDGRAIPSVSNVASTKRARLDSCEESEDPYVDWVPANTTDTEYASLASTFTAHSVYEYFIEDSEVTKRKRYTSSDDPMKLWRQDKHVFLDHLVRQDGLGNHLAQPQCALCHAPYVENLTRIFRCDPCGRHLQCLGCLEESHRRQPLHRVKEWNGSYWTRVALHQQHAKDFSPSSLQFVYQLGHGGEPCIRPASSEPQTMVVLDVGGVFTCRVRFCGCERALGQDPIAQLMNNGWYPATTIDPATCATFEALEDFRLSNVVGNISAHDYVGKLERLTDPTLLGTTPDRYKAFGRMSRQYSFLKRAKLPPGGIAVPCWACPSVGFNLPEGWETCSKDDEFLYSLLLALDANFRLKNRIRTNEKHDPSLGPGWGYFVESDAYKEHLRDYVAEADVSTCIAFAALMQKDTRLTTGLRVSGVGGCVCARHGVVRAQGLGDLQKGERYANMDYILLHALGDTRVKRLVLSYDIACQWKQRLVFRVSDMACSAGFLPDLSNFTLQFALPVWHAAAARSTARRRCPSAMHMGFATKEMGEGNRHDSIEDKVDHINFEKNVGQGDALGRKLIIAVAGATHRSQMASMVTNWVADNSYPNPYVMQGGKDAGPSEAQVAADLKKAELEDLRQGREGVYEGRMTATAFIKGLLQLEDQKRRIRHEVRGKSALTADRASQIDELRATFFKKLKNVQQEQEVYMPGVSSLRAAEEERRDSELPPSKAEDTKLWLPSDLTEVQRVWACKRGLAEVEAKLREAQCGDALVKIRGHLYTKTHLIHTRNATSVGQVASTRSSTLIDRVGDRIDREVAKYTEARAALHRLKGPSAAPHLKQLTKSDLHVRTETESDARARIRLGRLGASRRGRNEPSSLAAEERSAGVSWIWNTVRPEDDEKGLHEAVRVQWSKALARRDRWIEEVRLLREERTRVLRSLVAIEARWMSRASSRTDVEPRLAAGLEAYAKLQAVLHRQIAEGFYERWHIVCRAALRPVLSLDERIHRLVLDGGSSDDLQLGLE
ncbi:CxC2 domain-containing protein [Mycena indigotica]|uniref:CxC2 domain-containing protein n=1 Tax=Mycena indigotica TaxID=2126181 RepID=A0A8H6T6K1_9AGAR|nr:CxC2 domain-containing protein [Mycena indigotica]KAF7312718.1 CxC2 domain-containing protein [Mycena indigotica]